MSHIMISSGKEDISSPNYPSKYGSLSNCMWIIEGPVGKRLQMTVSTSLCKLICHSVSSYITFYFSVSFCKYFSYLVSLFPTL